MEDTGKTLNCRSLVLSAIKWGCKMGTLLMLGIMIDSHVGPMQKCPRGEISITLLKFHPRLKVIY